MIQVQDISYIYNINGVKTHALQNITFEVGTGNFVAIMGKSGVGKSTLLKIMAGLLPPATGSILVNEFELAGATEEELADYRLRQIGMMYQDFNLADFLTVFENVTLPGQIASVGKLARETRAEELLRTFDIIQYRDRYSTQLSGGEKQRVALCVALANDPDILLCDEPTGNLDRDNSTHIYEYLRKINQDHNKTIILVTHDQGIKPYVDKVYYLDRDQIVEADNHEN